MKCNPYDCPSQSNLNERTEIPVKFPSHLYGRATIPSQIRIDKGFVYR